MSYSLFLKSSCSRRIWPHYLVDHNLWWKGPDWLKDPEDIWIKSNKTVILQKDLLKIKTETNAAMITTDDFNLLNQYSSLQK